MINRISGENLLYENYHYEKSFSNIQILTFDEFEWILVI